MLNKSAKLRLKKLSQALRGDLSQRDFAEIKGFSHSTIQKWEAQEINGLPSEKSLRILARLCKTSVDDVIEYLLLGTESLKIEPVPEGRPRHNATVDADLLVSLIESLPDEDRAYIRDKVWGEAPNARVKTVLAA
jgi:transcriptional regulator with XRE-family HTH domain